MQMTLQLFWTVRVSPSQLPYRQILNLFSEISGLRLNNWKTEALRIGANIGNELNLNPKKGFKCEKNKVRALGIWHSTNPKTTIEANYSEKIK